MAASTMARPCENVAASLVSPCTIWAEIVRDRWERRAALEEWREHDGCLENGEAM